MFFCSSHKISPNTSSTVSHTSVFSYYKQKSFVAELIAAQVSKTMFRLKMQACISRYLLAVRKWSRFTENTDAFEFNFVQRGIEGALHWTRKWNHVQLRLPGVGRVEGWELSSILTNCLCSCSEFVPAGRCGRPYIWQAVAGMLDIIPPKMAKQYTFTLNVCWNVQYSSQHSTQFIRESLSCTCNSGQENLRTTTEIRFARQLLV
jgi:hypothetical protein